MVPRVRRDAALTSRAVQGRPKAFTALYERHHQALYRYCRSIVGHDEDARDAVQSAMLRAFAALQTEQRDFELKPWLFRIAHNEAISLLRRRADVAQLDEASDPGSDSLQQAVDDRAELAQLRADLRQLSERQRSALVLRELSGLTHEEIAAVLETTPRAVKQVIFEARTALEELREGRAMPCDDVCRALSDGDGRIRRGRRMRAHLRACDGCAAFSTGLGVARPSWRRSRRRCRPGQRSRSRPRSFTARPPAAAGAGTAGGVGATATSGGMLAAAGSKLAVGTVIAGLAAGGAVVAPRAVELGTSHGPARQERAVPAPAARRAPAVPLARRASVTVVARRVPAHEQAEPTSATARAAAPERHAGAPAPTRHTPRHGHSRTRTAPVARRPARTVPRPSRPAPRPIRPPAAPRAPRRAGRLRPSSRRRSGPRPPRRRPRRPSPSRWSTRAAGGGPSKAAAHTPARSAPISADGGDAAPRG